MGENVLTSIEQAINLQVSINIEHKFYVVKGSVALFVGIYFGGFTNCQILVLLMRFLAIL